MAHISVLGSGGWGTALAVMADREGHDVRLWSPFEQEVSDIRRHGEHRKLLPGVPGCLPVPEKYEPVIKWSKSIRHFPSALGLTRRFFNERGCRNER